MSFIYAIREHIASGKTRPVVLLDDEECTFAIAAPLEDRKAIREACENIRNAEELWEFDQIVDLDLNPVPGFEQYQSRSSNGVPQWKFPIAGYDTATGESFSR